MSLIVFPFFSWTQMEHNVIQQTISIIVVINFIILIGLVVVLRRWKKDGKLTEKRLALLLTGYFSLSTIITLLPVFEINYKVTILVDLFFLSVFWIIGYPWIRWLYRRFDKPR